jgi:hypothetical protein
MLSIRPANEAGLVALFELDLIARVEAGRRDYIRRAVLAGSCHVAVEDTRVAGYLIFDHTFFEEGFVPTLYIAAGRAAPSSRRHRKQSGPIRFKEERWPRVVSFTAA